MWHTSDDKLQTPFARSLSNRATYMITRDQQFGLLSTGQPSQATGQDMHGHPERYVLSWAQYLTFLPTESMSWAASEQIFASVQPILFPIMHFRYSSQILVDLKHGLLNFRCTSIYQVIRAVCVHYNEVRLYPFRVLRVISLPSRWDYTHVWMMMKWCREC